MKKWAVFIFVFIFSVSFVFAKRLPPPEVEPIVHNGFEFSVDYSGIFFQGEGSYKCKAGR